MKTYTVGILGAPLCNYNMGCVALTYSLITMLEKISREEKCSFYYYVFEHEQIDELIQNAEEKLGIIDRIKSIRVTSLYTWPSSLKHPCKTIFALRNLSNCNIFIDLTVGDSFTDIYGRGQFLGATRVKLLVSYMKKPLILGPQTYGPFLDKDNERVAIKAIESAQIIISRDKLSKDYIQTISDRDVYSTTDLAFQLPFCSSKKNCGRIKVGLNVSGLLVKNKTEMTDLKIKLNTDYEHFIDTIIENLMSDDKYELYFIPHVGWDALEQMIKKYPKVKYFNPFLDPVSAKNCISEMDIFIGARMHATIAAISSGVAVIPTAYSRKFRGVFENIGYDYIIDLENLPTEEAIQRTMTYILEYKKLEKQVNKCMQIIEKYNRMNFELFRGIIRDYLFENH